jgi:hypothetical protein
MGFSVEGLLGIGAFGYTGFSVLKPLKGFYHCALGVSVDFLKQPALPGRAFRTRPFRRTRTQTEVRNSDSDSGSDLRNRDFPTP